MQINEVDTQDALLDKFDRGDNMSDFFDFEKAEQPNLSIKRVNVDFPQWMVDGLDAEGSRLGVSRQAVIKMWVANRLDQLCAS
jgi:hypothetical protein